MGLVKKVSEGVSGSMLYLNIKAGNIVQSAKEGDEGAERRDWEKQDGTKGVSFEIPWKDLEGFIVGMGIKSTDFGDVLLLDVDNDGDKARLSISLDSRYFADFAKKASNIDFTKLITINAYEFTPKGKDKKLSGVSLIQEGEKLTNFYWDGSKNKKGYPAMEEENPDSDDWKLHFLQERKYLKKQLLSKVVPKVEEATKDRVVVQKSEKLETTKEPKDATIEDVFNDMPDM